MRNVAIVIVVSLLSRGTIRAAETQLPAESDSVSGRWQGAFKTRSERVGMTVNLRATSKGLAGSVYVPMWGSGSWDLCDVRLDARHITFRLVDSLDGDGEFDGLLDNGQISGLYTWQGRKFSFAIGRGESAEAKYPRYPQIPSGPPPYTVEKVKVAGRNVELVGILTRPKTLGVCPVVLMISGDELNPMLPITEVHIPGDPTIHPDGPWIIGDQLARCGIASLRVNPRGIGGSTGGYETSSVSDLVDDMCHSINFLSSHKFIDKDRVAVISFGDRGVVGAQVVCMCHGVRCLTLLGVPAVSEAELYGRRARRQLRLWDDLEGHAIQRQHDRNLARIDSEELRREERILSLVKDGRTAEEIRVAAASEFGFSGDQVKSLLEQFINNWTCDYRRSLLRYDPAGWLKELSVPVFAAAGGLDVRTCPEFNLVELEKCRVGHADTVVKTYPGLTQNLVKPWKNDFVDIVFGIDPAQEMILDPSVLNDVVEWNRKELAGFSKGTKR